MTISEMIKELEAIKSVAGDVDVLQQKDYECNGISRVLEIVWQNDDKYVEGFENKAACYIVPKHEELLKI